MTFCNLLSLAMAKHTKILPAAVPNTRTKASIAHQLFNPSTSNRVPFTGSISRSTVSFSTSNPPDPLQSALLSFANSKRSW